MYMNFALKNCRCSFGLRDSDLPTRRVSFISFFSEVGGSTCLFVCFLIFFQAHFYFHKPQPSAIIIITDRRNRRREHFISPALAAICPSAEILGGCRRASVQSTSSRPTEPFLHIELEDQNSRLFLLEGQTAGTAV